MKMPPDFRRLGCAECANGAGLDFEFTMAFQPIVDTAARRIFAHEALVRGAAGEPASAVFAGVNEGNRYRFDQSCRTKAIRLAAELRMEPMLSINFLPNAVYRPELCIRTTLEAAATHGIPIDRIIFEITEGERIDDVPHVREIVEYYKAQGFKTALDDFGAGFSGLNLLAEIQTDFIKLDMALIRGIVQVCRDLAITVIAEGVETPAEWRTLEGFGITLFQGFLFARPCFGGLETVAFEG